MMISIGSGALSSAHVEQAAEAIRGGGVIVYPTDSTYGFACDMHNKAAIERILAIKRMPRNKLLTLICGDIKDISQYAFVSNPSYKTLKRLLPGPYTFVLPATKLVPKLMLTRQSTIGVRVPDHSFCQALVKALGQPFLSTSARIEDGPTLAEPLEIHQRLGKIVDMVVDAGIILPYPSSILDLRTDPPTVIREGKGDVSWLKPEGEAEAAS